MRRSIINHVYLGLRWPKNKHWLASCMYARAVGNQGAGGWGIIAPYPQVWTDQLNSIPTGGGGLCPPHYLLPTPLYFQTFLRPCMRGAPTILIICIHNIIHGESPYWKPNCSEARLLWDTPWTTISRRNLGSFWASCYSRSCFSLIMCPKIYLLCFFWFFWKIGIKRTITYVYCYWNFREHRIKLLHDVCTANPQLQKMSSFYNWI